MILQMAQKAVNDSVGPDGIIPTLLVFGAYPRMIDLNPPTPSIQKRAKAIHSATEEVRKLLAIRQIRDALATRNGPNTLPTLSLPLNSPVRVWRENKGWQGPYRLLGTDGETCTVKLPHGPVKFRATVVKPYLKEDKELKDHQIENNAIQKQIDDLSHKNINQNQQITFNDNKINQEPRRNPTRIRNLPIRYQQLNSTTNSYCNIPSMTFISSKEASDRELAIKLRREGIIKTAGEPFEASQKLEIDGLTSRKVFELIKWDPEKYKGVRIFNSRMVNEVKGKETDTPYEKSRLVIQEYNDEGKEIILTLSPTIQRASQQLIMALAPLMFQFKNFGLYIRDVKQAYTHSETMLNRLILAKLPRELTNLYPSDTIMKIN